MEVEGYEKDRDDEPKEDGWTEDEEAEEAAGLEKEKEGNEEDEEGWADEEDEKREEPSDEDEKDVNAGADDAALPNAEEEPNENVDVVAGLLLNEGNVSAMTVQTSGEREGPDEGEDAPHSPKPALVENGLAVALAG